MTQAPDTHPSVTVYTPARLALYDVFILGLSCSLVWRCPRRHFLDLYDQHVGSPHLDIGVGTGYFLDRCRFPIEPPADHASRPERGVPDQGGEAPGSPRSR